MTLLIFTPTWIDPRTQEDAIHPDCAAAIKAQAGVEFDWHVTADNPHPIGDYRNVLHQYRKAREWFLNTGDHEGRPYEALVTVEHDNVLPDPDALWRMVETPGAVVYAPYLFRHGMPVVNTFQYINDRNLGMSLSNYRHELSQARAEVVHRVSGAGFGCTLIQRRVLEAVEFSEPDDRDRNQCPDLRFAEDCLRKKFISYGRFDVPVLHWDGEKWLHPFQSRRNSVTMYIALETMNALAAGRHMKLLKDMPISLSEEEARELSRLGVIRLMEVEPPAPQAEMPAPAAFGEEVEIITPRRRARSPKG